MFEKIFKGLERAHGCTKVQEPVDRWCQIKRAIIRSTSTSDHGPVEDAPRWYAEFGYYTN